MERPLVVVRGLTVRFGGPPVVRGVDLTLHRGERLALVGESGSGKSVTARCLLGLAGDGALVTVDRLEFAGRDLSGITEKQWHELRGARVGLVPQDALSALDPLRRVGQEVGEVLVNHGIATRSEALRRAAVVLEEAGIPDGAAAARRYPHQLSGGLRQRALVASAVAALPDVLVADEPTAALDAEVRARVLDLLSGLAARGTALLLISHDLAAVADIADRVVVMHEGEVVEEGRVDRVLGAPEHPYTRKLLAAAPSAATSRGIASDRVVLEVQGVRKVFTDADGAPHIAVDDVSFRVHAGEVLGLVGGSGSGKTTVASVVMGLLNPDGGDVRLLGEPWSKRSERERRRVRGSIQLVQQDALGSFDPRWPVHRILGEAFGATDRRGLAVRQRDLTRLLDLVGLPESLLDRHPLALSGGQRQRVAIARALAREPEVVVCDEPVSALDASTQAQVLDLFLEIRDRLGVALVVISHDLAMVRAIADTVVVMRAGRVVESGPAGTVLGFPEHPYTRALLAAAPRQHIAAPSALRTTSAGVVRPLPGDVPPEPGRGSDVGY
ncbi:ABC transporter ATP-binding protein [Saccharothrix sp. SC076]|nr:ABC transporter ATP-binding protein [Saccharothrix obliqua]